MQSPITGKPMKLVKEKTVLEFRNEKFEILYQSYLCEQTGEHYTTEKLDSINLEQVLQQYQQRHPDT